MHTFSGTVKLLIKFTITMWWYIQWNCQVFTITGFLPYVAHCHLSVLCCKFLLITLYIFIYNMNKPWGNKFILAWVLKQVTNKLEQKKLMCTLFKWIKFYTLSFVIFSGIFKIQKAMPKVYNLNTDLYDKTTTSDLYIITNISGTIQFFFT